MEVTSSHTIFYRNLILVSLLLFFVSALVASEPYKYYNLFNDAYHDSPQIPEGLLQAVAFTNTRIRHINPPGEEQSCIGIPESYGVMGLVLDGKGYFRDNLLFISELSEINQKKIIDDPGYNINAYALAFVKLQSERKAYANNPEDNADILIALSELPRDDDFAVNSFLYSVFSFLNNVDFQNQYRFPKYQIDLESYFGSEKFTLLSASGLSLRNNRSRVSSDYGPAIWDPTSCNFSTRSTGISAVTIHTAQGSYAGTISWFKNCNASVSAHYVIRSSDGQVTQLVPESEKAWHVGSENSYTIGIEHEGYVEDNAWYTTAMYSSSAALVKDIANSGYGINPLSVYKKELQEEINDCYRIKGHVHFPNQTHTDPGVNWDWGKYYDLINDQVITLSKTACTGDFVDNGGENGNYLNFEKYLTIIEPPGVDCISMNFSRFHLENDYDFLHFYDGDNINAPLIGSFTGNNSPGTITASSGKLGVLFDSDCILNEEGWSAKWTCSCNATSSNNMLEAKTLSVNIYPNPSNGVFSIEVTRPANKDVVINVFNYLGATVKSYHLNKEGDSSITLDLSFLPSGIYPIEIRSFENSVVKKAVLY